MNSVTKLREKQERLTNSINSEKANLEKISKDRLDAEKTLTETNNRLDEVKKNLAVFEGKLEKVKKETVEVSTLISTRDSRIKELDKKINEKQNELTIMEAFNKAKEKDFIGNLKKLEDDFNKKKASFKNEIDELEETRAVLINSNEVISDASKQIEAENEKKKKVSDDLDKDIALKEYKILEMERNADNTKKEINTLNEEVLSIKKQIKDEQKLFVDAVKNKEKTIKEQEKEQKILDKSVAQRIAFSKKEEELKIFEADLRDAYKKAGMEYPVE